MKGFAVCDTASGSLGYGLRYMAGIKKSKCFDLDNITK